MINILRKYGTLLALLLVLAILTGQAMLSIEAPFEQPAPPIDLRHPR